MSVGLRSLDGLQWLSNFLWSSNAILRWLIQMIVHLYAKVTLAPLQSASVLMSEWAVFLRLLLVEWLSEITLHWWWYGNDPMLLLFNNRGLSHNLSKFRCFFQVLAYRILLKIWRTDYLGWAWRWVNSVKPFSTDTFLWLDCIKLFWKVRLLLLRHSHRFNRKQQYFIIKLLYFFLMLLFELFYIFLSLVDLLILLLSELFHLL